MFEWKFKICFWDLLTFDIAPATKRKHQITDFFGESKDITKQQKLDDIYDHVEHKSIEQVAAYYMDRKAKEGNTSENANEMLLSRVHGPKKKVFQNESPSKAVISHDTLFRIKTEINPSGKKMVKIATILNSQSDINIEPNFQDAITAKNNELKDFFDHQTVDLFIYEAQDFQFWTLNEQGHLIDKVKFEYYKL